jgi:hypothetical protein
LRSAPGAWGLRGPAVRFRVCVGRRVCTGRSGPCRTPGSARAVRSAWASALRRFCTEFPLCARRPCLLRWLVCAWLRWCSGRLRVGLAVRGVPGGCQWVWLSVVFRAAAWVWLSVGVPGGWVWPDFRGVSGRRRPGSAGRASIRAFCASSGLLRCLGGPRALCVGLALSGQTTPPGPSANLGVTPAGGPHRAWPRPALARPPSCPAPRPPVCASGCPVSAARHPMPDGMTLHSRFCAGQAGAKGGPEPTRAGVSGDTGGRFGAPGTTG